MTNFTIKTTGTTTKTEDGSIYRDRFAEGADGKVIATIAPRFMSANSKHSATQVAICFVDGSTAHAPAHDEEAIADVIAAKLF